LIDSDVTLVPIRHRVHTERADAAHHQDV
jgi:hypothetical protein